MEDQKQTGRSDKRDWSRRIRSRQGEGRGIRVVVSEADREVEQEGVK